MLYPIYQLVTIYNNHHFFASILLMLATGINFFEFYLMPHKVCIYAIWRVFSNYLQPHQVLNYRYKAA
ncbi:MAG: hypothetical protein FD155_2864 [Bacteroidetes bacterium]|nr:MAG: hypothetical protein FD155_2864 [Bacteroidota bacterium]